MLLRPLYTEITGILSNTLKISHVPMCTEILDMIDNSSSHPQLSNLYDRVTLSYISFLPLSRCDSKFLDGL
jgi:hypothetical protein